MIDMGVILLVLLIVAGSLLALDDLERVMADRDNLQRMRADLHNLQRMQASLSSPLPEPKTPKTGASDLFNLYLLLGIVIFILVSTIFCLIG